MRWSVSVLVALSGIAGCSSDAVRPAQAPLTRPDRALAAMSPDGRQVVQSAHVPFLLLPEPFASVAVATSGDHFSALSARVDELTVSLHGTDVTHDAALTLDEVQRARPSSTVRGVPARVLENEGIRSVAWNERGVDWALEVECYEPETDVRCTEDAFVLDLAGRLSEVPR